MKHLNINRFELIKEDKSINRKALKIKMDGKSQIQSKCSVNMKINKN